MAACDLPPWPGGEQREGGRPRRVGACNVSRKNFRDAFPTKTRRFRETAKGALS